MYISDGFGFASWSGCCNLPFLPRHLAVRVPTFASIRCQAVEDPPVEARGAVGAVFDLGNWPQMLGVPPVPVQHLPTRDTWGSN